MIPMMFLGSSVLNYHTDSMLSGNYIRLMSKLYFDKYIEPRYEIMTYIQIGSDRTYAGYIV